MKVLLNVPLKTQLNSLLVKKGTSALLLTITLLTSALLNKSIAAESPIAQLANYSWGSGSVDCKKDNNPAIETVKYNENTYIFRQNKCVHYEAPFIYLLIGKQKALVIDTGATADPQQFPLAKTITNILANHPLTQSDTYETIVAHSHSHSDHIAGDEQFKNIKNMRVVTPKSVQAVSEVFGLTQWPQNNAEFDLGDRRITVIPTPGHQTEAIAIYDNQTQWLLTGDTFYPGRLYIKDWLAYKTSTNKLTKFSQNHHISAILGAHIEMSAQANKDYKMGSTYQPNEASLVLYKSDLERLNSKINELGNLAQKATLDKLIVYPLK